MVCSCKDDGLALSFNDLGNETPQNPIDILAFASLNSVAGSYYNSSNYILPAGSSIWIATPITVSVAPIVTANGTDDLQAVADATQWNFAHKTASLSSTVAPPIRKMLFMRAGTSWLNTTIFSIPVSPTFSELQLSMLENSATRGDSQGTVPVIRFASGPYSSTIGLSLTFNRPGRFLFGLLGINSNSTPDYSMMELDVTVVM